MTVTEPCVSPTTGTLGPDLRVNYAYGMVLGLDEFLQEQLHRLTKTQLHERGRHGYGTVNGLAVSVAPAGSTDYTVAVSTGIGVDQWGREIVIRCDQCARIGAWLRAQEETNPGILGKHLGADGRVTVYVVASYAECLDALVPLPGQPCSSSDQTMVPSRIRDAWDVELRWQPPLMPRWDTDRRLARLLGSVRFVAGLPEASSSEADILTAVLDLAAKVDDGPGDLDPPPGTTWELPLETAAAVLDRILTAWVTHVRPVPAPDLTEPDPASDPAILLSSITFEPAQPFDPADPVIVACDDPVDEGRPYLLHTGLIQELRWLGERGEVVPPPEPEPPVSLVTLFATGGLGKEPTRIDAWFQTEKPVHLPETINVTDEDGGDSEFIATAVDDQGNPVDFSFVWTLTAKEPGISSRPGLQLRALFPSTSIHVGDLSVTLLDYEAAIGIPFLDQDASGDVTAFAAVHGPAQVAATAEASKEFVEITTVLNNGEQLVLELWFHLQPREWIDNVAMIDFELKIFDDPTGQPVPIGQKVQSSLSPNLWYLELKHPEPGRNTPVLLRHLFPTHEAVVTDPNGDKMPLDEWINRARILYIGWDEGRAEIIAFSRSQQFREIDIGQLFADGQPFPRPPFQPPAPGPIVVGPFAVRDPLTPIRPFVVTPVEDVVVTDLVITDPLVKKAVAKEAVVKKTVTPAKAAATKAPSAPAKKVATTTKTATTKTPTTKTATTKKTPAKKQGGGS